MLRQLPVACLALIVCAPLVHAEVGVEPARGTDCIKLAYVPTSATEPSADLYISKSLPELPTLPQGQNQDQPLPADFTFEVLNAVLGYIRGGDMPVQQTSLLVQVEIVLPAGDAPPHDGLRVTVAADIAACAGL